MGSVVAVDQTHPSEAVLEQALAVLQNKGVLVMPTDSVYGIGCAAFPNNPAHRRIFTIKQRDLAQTLPWLVGTSDALQRYGKNVPSWMVNLAQTFWPGALTLVVPASDEVAPEYRNAQDNTIGLRMPASPSGVHAVASSRYAAGNYECKYAWSAISNERSRVGTTHH